MAQPTVSQHLKELKNAGLIKGSVEGNSICYCIDENGFEKVKSFFQNIHEHIEKRKPNVVNLKNHIMKLSEVKNQLSTLETVTFQLPNGTFCSRTFHVTEVGLVTKNFIDCGGTVRNETVVNFQTLGRK